MSPSLPKHCPEKPGQLQVGGICNLGPFCKGWGHMKFTLASVTAKSSCEMGLQGTVLITRKLFSPKGRVLILACYINWHCWSQQEQGYVNIAVPATWLCNDRPGVEQQVYRANMLGELSCFQFKPVSKELAREQNKERCYANWQFCYCSILCYFPLHEGAQDLELHSVKLRAGWCQGFLSLLIMARKKDHDE